MKCANAQQGETRGRVAPMARRLVLCIVVGWAALAPLAAPAQEDPVAAFRKTMEQAAEDEAFAIAQEAYLYGYPRVEMARRMHNETHRVDERQTIFAPPNRFYYFDLSLIHI